MDKAPYYPAQGPQTSWAWEALFERLMPKITGRDSARCVDYRLSVAVLFHSGLQWYALVEM